MINVFRKISIRQKLWSLSAIIISILVSYFYFYLIYSTEQQFREGLLKKGVGLVQTISFNLGPGLYFQNSDFIHKVLQGIQNDPDLSFLYLAEKSNKRVYGFRDEKHENILRQIKSSHEINEFVGDYLIIKHSILYNDEYQGYLVAGFNLTWVYNNIADQRRKVLLATFFLVLILVIFTSLFSKAISKPINEVISKINQFTLEEFNPEVRLPEEGNDEIKQLSVAFNYLSDSLGKNLESLRQSNKYIEALFRSSPLPILISDSQGNIEYANESACSYFNMKSDQLTRKNLEIFFNPLDFNAIINKLDDNNKKMNGYITTIKLKDGESRVVEISLSVLLDNHNQQNNYIIAIVDITEKISTQREILENQTKLHRVNWELIQKTYELESAINKNKKSAGKLANLIEISGAVISSKSPGDVFNILIRQVKDLVDAEACVLFLWNSNDKILSPAKANPAKILKDLKPVQDYQGVVRRTFTENQSYFLDNDSLQKSDLKELNISSKEKVNLISVPLSEKDYNFGVVIYLKYQNAFYIEDLHLITTLSHQGAITLDKIYLLQALKEKATHLQKAYSDLKMSQEQILQLQKMESLGTLVGGIAHDFNNILGIITPNVDLIRMSAEDNKDILKRVSIIHEVAGRAADLTRQLLMFSRNQDMKLETISLKQIVLRLSNMLKRTIGKDIEIKTEFESDVPVIIGDETRITQVIINLALNARDAMPEGGTLTLGISSDNAAIEQSEKMSSDHKYVCLYVKDTGSGISKENLSKIFDPFFTTKSVGNGTGLGLSVVYGIIKSHNGSIRVESEIDKGTTFYIYFEVSTKPSQISKQIEIDYYPTGNEKILIVDDEDMIRDSIRDILLALGYNTITAEGGQNAIEILQKNPGIDLAIVDYVMPKMNGIETIKGLREINPGIKILLSSGYAERERLKNTNSGIDGFLFKPYHISDLSKKIKELLGKEVAQQAT